jgi:hypothetical protein
MPQTWGARLEPGVRWVGGNCLKASVAHLISATDIAAVPDNDDLVDHPMWLSAYNERLGRIGYRLEEISADRGLASRKPWVAVIDDAGAAHAVVCSRGNLVRFDPADSLRGLLPAHLVRYGLTLTPTRRVVPIWSPHRGGVMVVLA